MKEELLIELFLASAVFKWMNAVKVLKEKF